MPAFSIDEFDASSKTQFVGYSSADIIFSVDWDDVDHYATAVLLKKALVILNEHWEDNKYSHLNLAPASESDEEDDDAWQNQYEQAKDIMRYLEFKGEKQ